ncbi:alanine--tRNA ligase [Chloroflexota bacterium]
MTGDEIRALFLNFFEEKRHDIIPSASLIPRGDPTLLLTSAGMVQFKPYYLGEAVPTNPRLTSCQKCFRVTDLELVGDPSHLTFFEMLGNFSIGDYFKKETINWAWEFVSERLKLPPERLWITIFLDDDESFQFWRDLGIPEEKIWRFGEKDNYWGPAGDSGPCGPCSEIHYDFGEELGCGKDSCGPNCECGRFSEIWNLVFTQYDQDKEGRRTPLPKPNIDTGMGLERTAAIMQNISSVYQTDFFSPLLERISELAGKKYGVDENIDNAMRIVAEHGRSITFLIGDGIMPSKEGRGYVLRRLLRRAVLFSRRLAEDKSFLIEIAETTISLMGHVYPEIVQRKDFIIKVIENEEARFSETLNTGLELIENIIAERKIGRRREIPGEEAFRLYDTYGFPVELTAEIAVGRGLSVDLDGFEQAMEKQRERARAAHKFVGVLEGANGLATQLDIEETPFVGYHDLEHKSVIIGLIVNGQPVQTVAEGQKANLILETTPFYAEMGGQVGDTGAVSSQSGRFFVINTVRMPPDITVQQGCVSEGSLAVGDEVEAKVDEERRLDITRNHTATHLLHLALRQVLGRHVEQKGSLVAPDRLRFDFSHLTAVMSEELEEVQRIVNENIRRNLVVRSEEIPYQQAIKEGAIALFDEKYGDAVRVLKIGDPAVSVELCGGTHVADTGEIGMLRITGESSIGSGLRRIEAATGREVESFMEQQFSTLLEIARILDTSTDNLQDKVANLVTELNEERRQVLAMQRELAKKEAESLLDKAEVVNGVKLLVTRVSYSRMEIMRETSDFIRNRLKSVVVVLGGISGDKPMFLAAVTPDLIDKGYDAGKIVKEVAKVAGGGGGGKAALAQAGGKYKNKLDEALKLVRKLI